MTVFSSREFNQDVGRAKKAAASGPVIITDRGKPAHVLMTIEEYRRLTSPKMTLAQVVADSNADGEFEPPRWNFEPKIPDFS